MSGEISMITGVSVDALPSPVAASSNRFGSQRSTAPTEAPRAPETGATQPGQDVQGKRSSTAEEIKLLDMKSEQVQQALMTHNAIFSFERDQEDGRMYLHVMDKLTGEEIYRIPKNYLRGTDPQQGQDHKVDVHI
jgi:uncharacterized FlaG/YvyC family protein